MLDRKKMHQGSQCIAFRHPFFGFSTVNSRDGVSKTARCGFRVFKVKLVGVALWRTDQIDSCLCIFEDINIYLPATSKHRQKRDNYFFCQLES